jgi:anti-sigma regulatory factor (Ser/Thr protein kinase)
MLMTMRPFSSELILAAMPNAPYWARRHVQDVLEKWGFRAQAEPLESVLLVVSELVTNAVKATGGLPAEEQAQYVEEPLSVPYRELAELGYVRLRLSYDRISLLIEVWDRSEKPPEAQGPDVEKEGGRGLLLVESLCARWGWYPANNGGKFVWAMWERNE